MSGGRELTEEARAFLDAHRVGRLATAGKTGEPHVVPICYARVGNNLYFVADEKPKRDGPRALKRLRNIAENPRVALLIDDYDEDWNRLAFLLLHLQAEEVEDETEYRNGLAALQERYAAYREMSLSQKTHPLIRMTLRRWHSWRATTTAPHTRRRGS